MPLRGLSVLTARITLLSHGEFMNQQSRRTPFRAEGNLRTVHRVEEQLIKSKKFSLPGKKALSSPDKEWSVIIVDVEESPIERPKKNREAIERGKKKRHTLKSQLVVEAQSLKIICTADGTGNEHDFKLFKKSKVKPLSPVEILADKEYQGIKKIHSLSYTPFKKKQNQPLSSREKEYNRELAKHRIYIEHVIRCLQIFRILRSPYRNRCRRARITF